ncbi:Rieske 2Fe-2S domain-containing protein [Allosaccharopolyspora coralli]|uniref:Cytochrome bc1 complex Rieske iron-sulfur subunit n=1 Tax=Allosaccharopolyspora coralli TaxID=2665642 RepID=A0A5Q3Q9D8_9PSEU|nr:Rieske (2Fe-2S) protein [Allosaccharopolyspora coralli]QGK71168.1 Rieske 2Fe-2S domain-containing protein [Allosaccharopolyspora coralli]
MSQFPTCSRRHVLRAGGAVAAVCGAAACTSNNQQGSSLTDAAEEPPPPPPEGTPLVRLADVPVGGAAAAEAPDGRQILVVRPQEGVAEAFSAACTHEGCTVAPQGQQLECPCHGSVFDLSGNVVTGPADRPLDRVEVRIDGDQVVTGQA